MPMVWIWAVLLQSHHERGANASAVHLSYPAEISPEDAASSAGLNGVRIGAQAECRRSQMTALPGSSAGSSSEYTHVGSAQKDTPFRAYSIVNPAGGVPVDDEENRKDTPGDNVCIYRDGTAPSFCQRVRQIEDADH